MLQSVIIYICQEVIELNHITTLRKNAGFKSAKSLAIALNCSHNLVNFIELKDGGKYSRKPSAEMAIKMSKLLNCTLEDIFLPYYTTISNNEAS